MSEIDYVQPESSNISVSNTGGGGSLSSGGEIDSPDAGYEQKSSGMTEMDGDGKPGGENQIDSPCNY